jgi:hypothetical protein
MDVPVVFLTANGDQDRESSSILSVQARELAADRAAVESALVGLWSKEDEGLEEK